MRIRNVIAMVLLAGSYVAFVPGIRLPLITITASFEMMGRKVQLFTETRSILQTVQSLHDSGNDFVAGLILLFGVIVPVVKGLTLVTALVLRAAGPRRAADHFARAISKWAMNDVFVVAVYVAFLSARATDGLDAVLERGFYWFTAYVLLSLVALNFLKLDEEPQRAP
jgi:uncharacterized paraquat-inducible protein A